MRPRSFVRLALMALVPPGVVWAQTISTVEGLVRNGRGGVAGVHVVALDSLTGERRSAVTNDRGFFRMLAVNPGTYAVSASLLGYARATRQLSLADGQRAWLDLVLSEAASVLETVQVRAEGDAPIIDRTSVFTDVTVDEIEHLPLNSRNVMDLAAIAPGIRSFQPVSGRSLPAAGALRNERAINLYVDGLEMKNMNSGNVVGSPQNGSLLPVDGLQEFRVLLNPYDAEYTRGASYVVSAVTRRGTNETHGSAFGFFQNTGLIAVTDFQRRIANFAKPDVSRLQGGATLRGPVIRDRLFYAASYELANTDNFVTVIPGQPATNPTVWNSYAGAYNGPHRNDAALLRVTYTANERNALDATFSARRLAVENGFGGTLAHESVVRVGDVVQTAHLRHRWLASRTAAANEVGLQLVRWASEQQPLFPGPALRYPTLSIRQGDAVSEIHETQLRAVDRFTYARGTGPGSHLLKVGVELARVDADQFSPTNAYGVFRFNSETATSPDQATIGVGFTDPLSDRDARASLSGWIVGGYVNDEWRLAPRLLLNLGVRYDAELDAMNNRFTVPWASDTVLSARPDIDAYLNRGHRRDDLNNVSPRIALSWDVTGRQRMFVRGGFGIMYERIPGFVPFGERISATWRTYVFPKPGTLDAGVLRDRVIAGGGTAQPPSITLLPQAMDVPENRQWSVGVGARLTRSVVLNVDYLDQAMRHLFAPVNLNWVDSSVSPARRVVSAKYGNIGAWGDFARARYRALLTSVSYAPTGTMRFTLAHTLASARADWDVQTVLVPATAASKYYVMQRISGDERNRVVLSGTTILPKGIALSAVGTVASPRPYRTTVGEDVNKDGLLDDDWIDGKRYRVPPDRWKYWYRVLDLRATKAIAIGRGSQLTVIGEAFNVFNTENYSGYFGVQRGASGPRRDFGVPNGVFATRQFQLGTKLSF